MNAHILLVEDEEAIADPLSFLLEAEGYQVHIAPTGTSALKLFEELNPDLILLDLMLPEISGAEVCRRIRQKSTVPVIMLTAKDTEVDLVVGLELGADDYITKPYSTGELLARVKAILRRSEMGTQTVNEPVQSEAIALQDIVLDLERHELTVRGEKISIPLREFELLKLLMQETGRVLPRDLLIDRVWGSDYFGDTKTLDVHIKRIRNRIETDPKNPQLIQTVRGVGYRFG